MTPIIRKFVLKLLSKNRGSGITSIPGSQHRMIQESIITDTLLKRGVNPETITSEGMLQSILKGIEKDKAMIARSKAEAQKNLATVMDLKGRKIKPGAKIMGGEEVIETEAEIAERLGKGNKQAVENIKEKQIDWDEVSQIDPDDFATGGRAGFKSGSYLMGGLRSLGKKYKGSTLQSPLENPKLLGAELGHDGIMELMNLVPGLFATGGRAGFAGGGMGRRAFLKLMAALGATGVAAKSGLVNLLKGGGKQVAKELTQVPIKDIKGMPSWFKPLVNRVIKEGDDVTKKFATGERQIVHKTELPDSQTDVLVTQNLDSGDVVVDIGIEKHGFADGKFGQPVSLNYKAAEEIPLKGKKGSVKTKEEFSVEEAEFTGGHPENIKFEESTISKFGKHESNFDEVEMFAKGKPKKDVRKVSESLQKQNEDLADHFSNYPEPDDFASGGIAGGRVGMLWGGGIFKTIIKNLAKARGVKPSFYLEVTNYKALPREVKNLMPKKDFDKMKKGRVEMFENWVDMAKTRKSFIENIEQGKKSTAAPIFEHLEKSFKSPVPSGVTDKDILQGEYVLKNLKTQGRKLHASGGIARMLGE